MRMLILLLASGLWSCGEKYVVPPQYRSKNLANTRDQDGSLDQAAPKAKTNSQALINKTSDLDSNGRKDKQKELEVYLDFLPKKQHDKFRNSVSAFQEKALEKIIHIVQTIPTDKARKIVLSALAFFCQSELQRIIELILLLHSKNPSLINVILEKVGEVGIREKIKFYMLQHKLLSKDQVLLRRLRTELKRQKQLANKADNSIAVKREAGA